MMTLTGLVCESLVAEAKGPGGRIPTVLPIVLYTGLRRWTPALDPAALAELGDWVIQCDDATELLARTEKAASSGNGRTGP